MNLQNGDMSSKRLSFAPGEKGGKKGVGWGGRTSQASVAHGDIGPSLLPASSPSMETGTPPSLVVTLMVILA